MQNTSNQYYDFKFINLNFRNLTRNIDAIEESILQDLKNILIDLIEVDETTRVINDKFWFDNKPHKIVFNYTKSNRTLVVEVLSEDAIDYNEKKTSVALFGGIKTLTYTYPVNLGFLSSFIELFSQKITVAYNALEAAYLVNAIEAQGVLNKKLHCLLNLKLSNLNKEALASKCYFNVASWGKRDKKFIYIIDEKRTKAIIDYYKSNQPQSRSPYQMINFLLTERVPDQITQIAIEKGGSMEMKFDNFDYKKDERYYDFWIAERHLFEYQDLGMHIIASYKGQFLELIYPVSKKDEILKVIPDITTDLENQFKKNFDAFIVYHNLINRKSIFDARIYLELKDIFVKIVASMGSDMAKP